MPIRDLVNRIVQGIAGASDLQAPLLFVIVLAMLILPMPSWLLDFCLVINIALTFLVLLRTASVAHPLEFSVFPSVLLVTTLLRLAMNISATRLILGSGDEFGAGQIIHAFGTFVIGQNVVVGVVIFVILVIIQFVVITAGAGRVAEVAARFTLDAMPGKQMAIDADLNAGMIDEREARRRREEVGKEADFYGAMDGASKFVRGDAIAAVVMIIINVLGGFAVGMLIHKLPLQEAVLQYTVKTVGEGIVTQIPALIMSIATGLIVTRATSESNLGEDLNLQILGQYRTVGIAAVIMASFMLVPQLPKLPFMLGAGALGYLAYRQWKRAKDAPPAATDDEAAAGAPAPAAADDMLSLLSLDPIEVEIGYGLIHLADPAQGGDLLERITTLRKQIAMELGFVVPPVRVRDNIQLKNNGYSIKLWDIEVAQGEIVPRFLLAMNPADPDTVFPGAIPTREPAFGLPAQWIQEAQKMQAEVAGFTVVDPTTVLVTHLSEVIRGHAHEVLARQDVQGLLDKVRAAAPALVDDLVPKVISLAEVHRVLQNLLRERISIRDMNRILSTLGDYAPSVREVDQLTEHVRQALARVISSQYRGADGPIDVITLHPDVEDLLLNNLRPTQYGLQIVLDPASAQALLLNLKAQVERMVGLGYQPVLLCSTQLRLYLRRFVERFMPGITVLSHAEVAPGVQAQSRGEVTLAAPILV